MMWRRFQNFIFGIKTYRDLSPDVHLRHQVNRVLGDRPSLSATEWVEQVTKTTPVSKSVASFAYAYLPIYSGLRIDKIQLGDRLIEDLRWFEVCSFEWEMALCDDFWEQFHIDLSSKLEEFHPKTISELLLFLETHLNLSRRIS
jgi:hypothetical protein